MEQDPLPPADTSLAADTTAVVQALEFWWAKLGRQYGPLSRPLRRTLLALAESQKNEIPIRVSELADVLTLSVAGATRTLDKLEGLGYLKRFRSPQTDQRQVYVQLTDEGAQALEQANDIMIQRAQTMMKKLSSAERTELATLLQKLTQDPDDTQTSF